MDFSEILGGIGHVWESFADGYRVGHEINEHLVQHVLDEHQTGSGDLGHSYLDFINTHGDPAHAVETAQHFLDAAILHHDDHQSAHNTCSDTSASIDHNQDWYSYNHS